MSSLQESVGKTHCSLIFQCQRYTTERTNYLTSIYRLTLGKQAYAYEKYFEYSTWSLTYHYGFIIDKILWKCIMPLNHYDYLTVLYIADISSFLLPHLSELSSREEEQYSGLSSHSDFLFRVRVSFFYNSTVEIMHRYKTRIFEFL